MSAGREHCHGDKGKGNQELGAPDLTDKIWLYGSDEATLVETISNGRAGVMTVQPASHPSIAATQSTFTAPAESFQATEPKEATRVNAVHAARAKIARRNSLRMQRQLQKQSRL